MLSNAPVYAVLPCVDMEGAKRFYGEVLGLKEVEVPGASGAEAEAGTLFECGAGTNLFVYQRETPTKADHTAAGWIVEDLEAAVDALASKGVKMEVYDMPGVDFDEKGIASMGNTRGVWFKDPEGNILSLTELP